MGNSYFHNKTLDDIMRSVIKEVLYSGTQIKASKGDCIEIQGVMLEVDNPRMRISRTETKGKPFSALGELCWYLAKTNRLDFIRYYLPRYEESADGDIVYGGYGPRFFDWEGVNQVENIIQTLKNRPTSRQAVIQLFDHQDILEKHKDIPCTCTQQFMIRDGKLHMITSMRSNDIMIGLPHDVFCFTMLQELVARSLSVELGTYKHFVGSLHLYNENIEQAKSFLDEGWQSTKNAMPPMPYGDPWSDVDLLLGAEREIRLTGFMSSEIDQIDPYWADLIRLLHIFRCYKEKDIQGIEKYKKLMDSNVYNSFIDKMIYKE